MGISVGGEEVNDTKTLASELPVEQARVRKVLAIYQSIPEGIFGAAMIEQSLKDADEAVMSGDIIKMLAAYNDLKEIDV